MVRMIVVGAVCAAGGVSAASAAEPALSAIPALSMMPIAALQPAATPPADAPPAPEAPPVETSFFSGWTGSVEFGLNGSDGNSETLNLRGGVSGARKTPFMETTASLVYQYSTDDGQKSKNRGQLDVRNDWIINQSPWSVFVKGSLEYDDFKDWDWRLSLFGGVGYAFIKNDTTLLRGRIGVGVTREFGGPDNDWVPEGLLGLDFEHKLSERSKITALAEYYPSFKNFSDFRLLGRLGYEIIVDPETKMTLKLGIEDRYDSNVPSGTKRNDIDYFALLAWNF